MSEELEQTEDEVVEQVEEEQSVEEPVEEAEIEEEPAHELSRPPVIDLNALLQPVSAENPSGEYLRYSGAYDEIGEARREDELLGQEDVQSQLKVADFKQVISLAVPVLEKETKDLQVAAWLSEALVKEHGFEGLRDSLKLLAGLQDKFWETLFPEIDEGDMEGRGNALAWMDKECAFSLQNAQITDGEGYNYIQFFESKKYDIPDDIDQLEYEQQEKIKKLDAEAKRKNKVTAEKWKQALKATRRAYCEELNVAIEECQDNLKKLNLVIEDKFDINQAPSLRNLSKMLEDIKRETDKILKIKREEEPDEIEIEEVDEDGVEGEGGEGKRGSLSSTKGAIQSRNEALKRLEELAKFFKKTEPHSPVSYLVSRAVKWGNMPLESWLQDVIKDENILSQIRQTLGFNTGNDGSTESEDDGVEVIGEDWT